MPAKRSLGQNFLVNSNLQRKIVDALGTGPEDEVLEIGPGHGELTQHLAGSVRRLTLVELDDQLAGALAERYHGREDVVVLHGDILDIPLAAVSAKPQRLKVLGNIPYNRTTPILFKLLERSRPAEIVVMVQREVADRILSPPGCRTYGALSVGLRSVARVERLLNIPRGAFRPAPTVDSTVIRIRPYEPAPLTPAEEHDLRRLTRAAFRLRRKQLQKILRSSGEYELDADDVEALARETGFNLSQRPEQLSPEELIQLARAITRHEARKRELRKA
ncbi:MAG: ribosomal RNA small subunit methyltransferase A [Gemmatimonadetes bacterium]|nr:ribosomal RNA small subunit methyltransferase A [Gemmatimonadota bacterium]